MTIVLANPRLKALLVDNVHKGCFRDQGPKTLGPINEGICFPNLLQLLLLKELFQAGDEIHLYAVPATNLLLARRAKRSTDFIGMSVV